jgi:hypothetical protein
MMFWFRTVLAGAVFCNVAYAQIPREQETRPDYHGPHEPWIDRNNAGPLIEKTKEAGGRLLFMRVGDLGVVDGKRDPADEAAWSDPRVTEWLTAHAVGARYQLSDDAKNANALELGSLTKAVYAIRNGVVVDRDLLFTSADEVLEWAKLLENGDVTPEFARKRAGERTDTCSLIPRAVYAERLRRLGEAQASADEYAWIIEARFGIGRKRDTNQQWPVGHPLEWDLFKFPIFHRAAELAPKFPAVYERLEVARDEMIERLIKSKPGEHRKLSIEFVFSMLSIAPDAEVFNRLMDGVADDPFSVAESKRRQTRLMSSLAEQGRWADAGKLVRDPVNSVRQCMGKFDALTKLGDAMGGKRSHPPSDAYSELADQTELDVATDCAVVYAALLAAGREKEASEAASAAFAIHDSPTVRAVFVVTCLDAKQVRPEHREWAKQGDQSPMLKEQPQTLSQQVEESLAPPQK